MPFISARGHATCARLAKQARTNRDCVNNITCTLWIQRKIKYIQTPFVRRHCRGWIDHRILHSTKWVRCTRSCSDIKRSFNNHTIKVCSIIINSIQRPALGVFSQIAAGYLFKSKTCILWWRLPAIPQSESIIQKVSLAITTIFFFIQNTSIRYRKQCVDFVIFVYVSFEQYATITSEPPLAYMHAQE